MNNSEEPRPFGKRNKSDWILYCFVFILSVLVHVLLLKSGSNASSDYQAVYRPEALQIIQWIKGDGVMPEIHGYQISHVMYVLVISFIFMLFGNDNLAALSIFQAIISIPVFLFILGISLKHYHSKGVAVLFTCLSLLFFENLQWVNWSVPDSLYRFLFIISYYLLLTFHANKRHDAFLVVLIVSFPVLVLIRIDTVLLLMPAVWLGRRILVEKMTAKRYRTVVFAGIVIGLGVLFSGTIGKIAETFLYFYIKGWVMPGTDFYVPGVTQIEPFDYTQSGNVLYLISREAKLILLRIYHFFNVFPPFWSFSHKVYYALHMVPFYVLSIAGLVRARKARDSYFIVFFQVYIVSMIIHSLTFVDAAKRQMYSSLPFLIMFAGYGFDYLYKRYKERSPRLGVVSREGTLHCGE